MWVLRADRFQIDSSGLNLESPRDGRTQQRGSDKDIKQRLASYISQQDWKQKRGHDSSDLCKCSGEPRTNPADAGRENLTSSQVGLRVRTEIGHKVEQHEPEKD